MVLSKELNSMEDVVCDFLSYLKRTYGLTNDFDFSSKINYFEKHKPKKNMKYILKVLRDKGECWDLYIYSFNIYYKNLGERTKKKYKKLFNKFRKSEIKN